MGGEMDLATDGAAVKAPRAFVPDAAFVKACAQSGLDIEPNWILDPVSKSKITQLVMGGKVVLTGENNTLLITSLIRAAFAKDEVSIDV